MARLWRYTSLSLICGLSALAPLGCTAKKQTRSARVSVTVATAAETPTPFQLTSVGTVEAIRAA